MAAAVAMELPTEAGAPQIDAESPTPREAAAPPTLEPAELKGLNLKGLKEGTTKDKDSWGKLSVSNAAGQARSHIHLESKWHVPPEAVFAIFTYPDNSAIFRDVKSVGQRRVVSSAPGLKVVEAEQLQDIKVLWMRRQFSTWLTVTEDSRNPECLTINFDLLKSDVLAQFAGKWEITPVYEEVQEGEQQQGGGAGSRKVVGCHAVLHQQVLPKGVPPFMQNAPVMGDLLRGVAMRAIRRVVDDLAIAVDKIQAGLQKGRTVPDLMRELCGACAEEGHANGAVKSFAIDDHEEEEDEEEEEQKKQEGQEAASKDAPTQQQQEPKQQAEGGSQEEVGSAAALAPGPQQPEATIADAGVAAAAAAVPSSEGPAAAEPQPDAIAVGSLADAAASTEKEEETEQQEAVAVVSQGPSGEAAGANGAAGKVERAAEGTAVAPSAAGAAVPANAQ